MSSKYTKLQIFNKWITFDSNERFESTLIWICDNMSLGSQSYIDIEKSNIYLTLYKWYCMPATVHKVLYHGTQIIKTSIIPIGQMSEEAQEARNKDIRRYRESFTRKNSRTNTNDDLIKRLLISSDPFITSLRKSTKKPNKLHSKAALELLDVEPYCPEEGEDEFMSFSGDESVCIYISI